MEAVTVVGGGLAGSEAAWQLAERGVRVTLYEMRPARATPAHKTDRLAELVCSNSLKSNAAESASGLLKEELRRAGSLLIRLADQNSVPGGTALTVDRERFAQSVTEAVSRHPLIEIRREEFQGLAEVLPRDSGIGNRDSSARVSPSVIKEAQGSGLGSDFGTPTESIGLRQSENREPGRILIATGPLTSDALAEELQALTGSEHLSFYDSISPIVDAETLNTERLFHASRYGKGGDDYLNAPMSKKEYVAFYEALIGAEEVAAHEFEDRNYFEACLPIEELARRGVDTLRFGPMKPVGLRDPRSGREAYAVVQLRTENLRFSSYNLVGFQNHLKFPEQKRILRMIPGLERAEFLRFGQIHRNTYINAPKLLRPDFSLRPAPHVFIAGQLSGVEGYVECIATGLVAGRAIAARARGESFAPPPRTTALGSLVHYVTHADASNYQPANIAFDLLPPLEADGRGIPPPHHDRLARRQAQCQRALDDLNHWLGHTATSLPAPGQAEIDDPQPSRAQAAP